MNIVTEVKIQSQQSIFINFLNTDLTEKFLEEFQIKQDKERFMKRNMLCVYAQPLTINWT